MTPYSTLTLTRLAWIPFRVTSLIVFAAIPISPVVVCREISQSYETKLVMFDQRLDVLLVAPWTKRAKAKRKILANLALSVTHWTIVWSHFAEALVIKRTIFLSTVTCRSFVSIDALLAFETEAFSWEVSTHGDFIFKVAMQIWTLLATLALLLQPVNADNFFDFWVVGFQAVRLVQGD